MKGRVVLLVVSGLIGACSRDSPGQLPERRAEAAALEPTVAEPEPEPVDPAQERARAVEALLETVDALAQIHRDHADDCAGLSTALRRFHAEHGAELAEAPAELLAHVDADEALRERMHAAMEAVMSAAMGCREDPGFVATQAELFGPAGE
jgi:hypothetical protein